MLIKQIVEFELSGPGPPGRRPTCAPILLVVFVTKQTSLRKILKWIIIYS